jgi:hypothetical protein
MDEGGGKENGGGVGKETLVREKYEIRYWRMWGRGREQQESN